MPAVDTLTRLVAPDTRSCTNTSDRPFESPDTRLDAPDLNDTYRPSPLIDGSSLYPFA